MTSAVVTVVVLLALLLVMTVVLLWPQFHQKSQANLTQRVEATVVDRALRAKTGSPVQDYNITYTYVVDGRTYRATAASFDGDLAGEPLYVCVDPTDPTQNAPLVAGAQCGDRKLGKDTSTAKPVD